MISCSLTLDSLKNESTKIFWETPPAFRRPVTLYSLSKEISAPHPSAPKVFGPGAFPLVLVHLDSRWKPGEMASFQDGTAKEVGFDLLAKIGHEKIKHGVAPFVWRGNYKHVVDDGRHPLKDTGTWGMRKIRRLTQSCCLQTPDGDVCAIVVSEVVKKLTQLRLLEREAKLMNGEQEHSIAKKKTEGCL